MFPQQERAAGTAAGPGQGARPTPGKRPCPCPTPAGSCAAQITDAEGCSGPPAPIVGAPDSRASDRYRRPPPVAQPGTPPGPPALRADLPDPAPGGTRAVAHASPALLPAPDRRSQPRHRPRLCPDACSRPACPRRGPERSGEPEPRAGGARHLRRSCASFSLPPSLPRACSASACQVQPQMPASADLSSTGVRRLPMSPCRRPTRPVAACRCW